MTALPDSSALKRPSRLLAGLAVVPAAFLFIWAVSLACTTLEPWGDSPRALYAGVADVALGLGTVLVGGALAAYRAPKTGRRRATTREWLLYLAAAVSLGIPLAISATNSYAASSVGEGGPSLLLVVIGGVGLTAGLAALMTRWIVLGAAAALALGGLLMAVALIAAR